MRRPQGHATLVDPDAPTREWDTFTCSHCNGIVHVEARSDPADAGGVCRGCSGLICPRCTGKMFNGGGCVPFEEAMRRMMSRQDALRSYGMA